MAHTLTMTLALIESIHPSLTGLSILLFLGGIFVICMLIHDNRPIKYENNEDAEGRWILKGVKNNGHLWALWKDNEENRYSELVFFPGGNCEGTGVFDHYGGVFVVADGKINITIAGEQYLNITINEAERFYASVTIVDPEGHIDEADFCIYRG